MSTSSNKLPALRQHITESLRIQRDTKNSVPYIDSGNFVTDAISRQNHTIFARRGCGKTLLLHYSGKNVNKSTRCVYLNCEDFKNHSFPNVLIEILDALFHELEINLRGWFGHKKRSKELIQEIRKQLSDLKVKPDQLNESIKETHLAESANRSTDGIVIPLRIASIEAKNTEEARLKMEVERKYALSNNKLKELDLFLPELKRLIREFFGISSSVDSVFLQIDDLYHLKKSDQPFVVDYVHRLCKDVPLYFKIATLRHASLMYVDRDGQPIGAQERHDYQPINIDYTFTNFSKTRTQNLTILYEFGKLAKMSKSDVDNLFKGEGFNRLVMAGGGVPRDTLSLFLEVISEVQTNGGDKIGKDEVRIISRSNFEKRIEELKNDSEGGEQDSLMRAIYSLREFCLSKKTNAFMVPEKSLQQNDSFRLLLYRLLDYRIIHSTGTALTHKHHEGTFHAFVIDIGCYAHLRKLDGKFNEIDVSLPSAKEEYRSAPMFGPNELETMSINAPADIKLALLEKDSV